jgi:exonuclease III
MKIATFNINGVNKRLGNLIGWLRAERPDVVALQELKATDREFPEAAIEKAGYRAVWRGQKTWNGKLRRLSLRQSKPCRPSLRQSKPCRLSLRRSKPSLRPSPNAHG